MKTQIKIIVLTTLAILTFGCNKDDDNNTQPLKTEKQIISFVFNADENEALTENITAEIDQSNNVITAIVPFGKDISSLTPTIQISENATVTPNGVQNFSSPVTYTITAEDNSKITYVITVNIEGSSEKQILNFTFNVNDNNALNNDIIADINDETKTIVFKMPTGIDLTALVPTIEISPEASINPIGTQDFSSPAAYTVTAQDGTTAIYEARIYSQIDVLIDLYNINTNNTLDWLLSDTNINNWTGVTTDENGNIIELELDSKNLDIIPSEIELLTSLTILNLSDNNLTNIPDEIIQLNNLTYLNASDNNLSSISTEIGLLTNLTSLILENNNLTTLPDQIWELTNLTYLNASDNNLSSISTEIGLLTNLTSLILENNNLTTLPDEIEELEELEALYLSNNNFSTIPNRVYILNNLITLKLGGNGLTTIIPDSFLFLSNLEHLNLSNNNITAISDSIFGFGPPNWTTLELGGNSLTNIPSSFGLLTDLTTLSLEDNELTSIPVEIGELTNLTTLSLENNNLTTIPQEVCDLNISNLTIDDGVTCE